MDVRQSTGTNILQSEKGFPKKAPYFPSQAIAASEPGLRCFLQTTFQ